MILFLWLLFCFLIGLLANSRGKSGVLYFFVSAVLSPIIGLIIVLVQPDEANKINIEELKNKIDKLERKGDQNVL